MSKKNLKLLIILLILAGFAYLYQGPFQKWQKDSETPGNFLSGINLGDVDKIEVSQIGNTQVLIKDGDKWKVDAAGDFYVSVSLNSTINKVLQDAIESDFEIVSSKESKKTEFKTADDGINMKIYQKGEEKVAFVVGTLGPDYVSTYVSQNGINDTYLVDANLFGAFSVNDFRDKTIFKTNKEDISKIRFQYPDKEFSVEKKDDSWVSESGEELDTKKISEILDVMTNLNSIRIPEQSFENTGLEKNLIIVEASGGLINNTIMVGESNDSDQYYAKKGDSDNIYLITEDQKNALERSLDDLK